MLRGTELPSPGPLRAGPGLALAVAGTSLLVEIQSLGICFPQPEAATVKVSGEAGLCLPTRQVIGISSAYSLEFLLLAVTSHQVSQNYSLLSSLFW